MTKQRKITEDGRKAMAHGSNKGRDMGGIQSLEGLKNHCRVTEDGCWIYAGRVNPKRKGRSPSIFLRLLGKAVSIGSAAYFVQHGRTTPKGYHFVAQCGHGLCANPSHRKLMRPGGHMTVKARHGEGGNVENLIPKPRKLTDADVVEIYTTRHEMTAQQQMAKWGISESYCHALRAGTRRVDALRSVNGPAGMFSQLLMAA